MSTKTITPQNQEMFFTSIKINRDFIPAFTRGQSGEVNDGNRIVLTANSSQHIRFKGLLQGLFMNTNQEYQECKIEMGNFVFYLNDIIPRYVDEFAIYENVRGMIFPSDKYQVVAL